LEDFGRIAVVDAGPGHIEVVTGTAVVVLFVVSGLAGILLALVVVGQRRSSLGQV
jgi:hypothetical protein